MYCVNANLLWDQFRTSPRNPVYIMCNVPIGCTQCTHSVTELPSLIPVIWDGRPRVRLFECKTLYHVDFWNVL